MALHRRLLAFKSEQKRTPIFYGCRVDAHEKPSTKVAMFVNRGAFCAYMIEYISISLSRCLART